MTTPKCTHARHAWKRHGGIKENPGVYGIGGAAISITEQCEHCGLRRNKVVGDVDYPTRNHGWRYERAE